MDDDWPEWREPNAKRMTFDDMARRAQHEWQRAEAAEEEVAALHIALGDAMLRADHARAEAEDVEKYTRAGADLPHAHPGWLLAVPLLGLVAIILTVALWRLL